MRATTSPRGGGARSTRARLIAALVIVVAALAPTVTSHADTTVPDGDGDDPVSAALNPLNFGTVCVGRPTTEPVLVAIKRTDLATDAQRTFANSATVTVSVASETGDTNNEISYAMQAGDATLVTPSDWLSQPQNTMTDQTSSIDPTATVNVTLTAAAVATTQREVVLSVRASGPNAVTGTTINRNTNVRVQWKAQNCDDDAPAVTGSIGTPQHVDGLITYVTSATTLSFDVNEADNGNSGLSVCTVSADGPVANDGSFTCAEGANDYTLNTSAPLSLGAAPPDGVYANSASATDNFTNSGGDSFDVTLDNTAPTFGSCTGGPYLLGSGGGTQAVSVTANDGGSGLDSAASTLSGSVSTTTVGTKTVEYTAKDNLGNTATKACDYSVVYDFDGFFQPVDNVGLNKVKAGQGIPVKFGLGGNQGLSIFAAGYPMSIRINCDTSDGVDPIESTVTAGGSSLSYDAAANAPDGQYNYVWKTEKNWAGMCRRLDVKLVDGTTHSAAFQFTR